MKKDLLLLGLMCGLITGYLAGLDRIGSDFSGQSREQGFQIEGLQDFHKVQSAADQSAIKQYADIDAMLALQSPPKEATMSEWLAFAYSLDEIDLGKGKNKQNNTPLLAWYVYIAKHRPEVIYSLLSEGLINSNRVNHLIEFGLLPDWHESIENPDQYLLSSSHGFTDLVQRIGAESTQRMFIKAFFSEETSGRYLAISNLIYSMPAMTEEERARILSQMDEGGFIVNLAQLNALAADPFFQDRTYSMLNFLNQTKHGQPNKKPSMRSNFLLAAQLGGFEHVLKLIDDIETNAEQPVNFYCAACILAVTSDGLLGKPLVEAKRQAAPFTLNFSNEQFAIATESLQ